MADEDLGLTERDVRELIEAHGRTWEQFRDWMYGQTYAIDSKGAFRYYRHDVERFLERQAIVD